MHALSKSRGGKDPIVLDEFDPRTIPNDAILLLLGKKGSGKTTLLMDLLYFKRHIPDGLLFCSTADSAEGYRKVFPDSFIHTKWSDELVSKFLLRMQRENILRMDEGLPKKYSILVVDDMGYNKDFTRSALLKELLLNGRHWGVFIIFTLQYSMDIYPDLRSQIDYVFIFHEPNWSNKRKLWEHYCGVFRDLNRFYEVLDATTENRRCLVVRNSAQTRDIAETLFWYKAQIRDPYRVGSRTFWKTHDKLYNQKWLQSMLSQEQDEAEETGAAPNKGKTPMAVMSKAPRKMSATAARTIDLANSSMVHFTRSKKSVQTPLINNKVPQRYPGTVGTAKSTKTHNVRVRVS